MAVFDEPIDCDQYRIDTSSFDPVSKESSPYVKIDAQLQNRRETKEPQKFCLNGSDQNWKRQIVYTVAEELSGEKGQTVPVFEISLPGKEGFEHIENQRRHRNSEERSAYADHLRSFFIEEDVHGRLTGLGPIGKCLKLSQEMPVILFLRGIDRVPGKSQSMFFSVLERNSRIQYGVEVEGEPENLTIFTTKNSEAEREKLDFKLVNLLGSGYRPG